MASFRFDDPGKMVGIFGEMLPNVKINKSKSTKKSLWLIFESAWKMLKNFILKNWAVGKVA